MTSIRLRRAAWHVGAAVVVIAGGLVWRLVPLGLSPFWLKYGGSVLWGAMVLLLFGAFRRGAEPSWTTPAAAAAFASAVEVFRLVHAPALDAFRLTLPGALLLGRVFSLWNVLAYWVGIAAAMPVHAALLRTHAADRS